LLRKEAHEACAKEEWPECKEKPDTADDVNPSGANEASIKQLREKAERGISGR